MRARAARRKLAQGVKYIFENTHHSSVLQNLSLGHEQTFHTAG
jgi:hypothetical protein